MHRIFETFPLDNFEDALPRFLYWAQERYNYIALLDNNGHVHDPYSSHEAILAVGAFQQVSSPPHASAFDALKDFSDAHQDWIMGFLSYDLKNQLEDLTSSHPDGIQMPLMHFFVPERIFFFREGKVEVGLLNHDEYKDDVSKLLEEIKGVKPIVTPGFVPPLTHRVSREEYLEKAARIKNFIQQGDIYETNYCIEFYTQGASIDPAETYLSLKKRNPAPFSCFYRHKEKYLISSSPERFMAKREDKLISQPIKGTIRRGCDAAEDELLKTQLQNDPKERSENVMIVDLVRNDLSQSATRGSVKVEELFGIYSFPRVHQMISTVSSRLADDVHYIDAIRKAFPMGSMTGAPKIRAMEIIEECEATRRGLYSGAVGYISPQKDFDFNVIIRSILYNRADGFLNFMAGSAITIDAIAEKEYDECLLKAGSMAQTIGAKLEA